MFIIISFILVLLVLLLVLESNKKRPVKYRVLEKRFCLFSYIVIVILAAFRGELVGADTLGYISDYMDVKTMSFSDIAYRYEGYVGYFYLSKLFAMAGMPLFVWFGFLELVLVSSISRFINKFSTDRLYSIILFIVTGLFMFSLAGLKQTLAMALMIHGYLDFSEKKMIRSVLWIIASFFVHPASLIMLIAFFLSFIRRKEFFAIAVVAIIIAFSVRSLLTVTSLVTLLGNDHFEMYLEQDTSYTMSTLYLYLLMLLCTIPYVLNYLRSGLSPKIEFSCVLILCACQYMASFSPNLFRLALMFIPFLVVYTPNTFECSKSNMIIKAVALIGPIIFYIYSNRNFVYYMSF